jgi:hypothetical protein
MAVIGEFSYADAAVSSGADKFEAEQAAGASVGVAITPAEVPAEPAPQPKAKTPK